jgi:hypothetical protein
LEVLFSLLPALIGFPSPGRVKYGPIASGEIEGSPLELGTQGEIVERPGRRIGQRGIGVVDLHEILAVRSHSVRVVHLGQAPVRCLDLRRRRRPLDPEHLVQAGRPPRGRGRGRIDLGECANRGNLASPIAQSPGRRRDITRRPDGRKLGILRRETEGISGGEG